MTVFCFNLCTQWFVYGVFGLCVCSLVPNSYLRHYLLPIIILLVRCTTSWGRAWASRWHAHIVVRTRRCSYGWACHRRTVATFPPMARCTLLENKYQKASETRLHELTLMQLPVAMCYHCVSKRCSAWRCLARHLYFRSSLASIRALTYAWNLLRDYRYLWPGFSLWIFLVVHTNRMSCLYTYTLHLIHYLSSVGLGTREVADLGTRPPLNVHVLNKWSRVDDVRQWWWIHPK